MIAEDKVIEILYMADEYNRKFSKIRQKYSLEDGQNDGKRRRNKPNRMSDAEIMVILILFPVLSSFSRFVELEKEVALSLALLIKDVLWGKCIGISFTDSTALRVCHIKRMHSHRTFSGLAQKGKATMGWFYGIKLHLIINDRGEILNFMITPVTPMTASRSGTSATCRTSGASSAGTEAISARPFSGCSSSTEYNSSRACATI